MDLNPGQGRSLRKILNSFWSRELGFSLTDLRRREVKIIGVNQQINIPPCWPLLAMEVNEGCIIPVKDVALNDAQEVFEDFSVEEVFTDEGIEKFQSFGFGPNKVAHWLHLYCSKDNFRPYRRHRARRLMPHGLDRKICEKWTLNYPNAIGPYSYQYANPVSYGMVVNGELVSVSVVLRYDLPFWEIGVQTRPELRRKGYGKSVVSLATEEVLADSKIAWYYIDVNPTNIASLKIAKALGYIECSETLNYKTIQ